MLLNSTKTHEFGASANILSVLRKCLSSFKFRLNPPEQQQLQWSTIGRNQYPLLIIDNVYANPEKLANWVHTQSFSEPHGKHINSQTRVAADITAIHQLIFQHYARHWGLKDIEQLRA